MCIYDILYIIYYIIDTIRICYYIMLYYIILCYVMLYFIMLCYITLYYTILYYIILHYIHSERRIFRTFHRSKTFQRVALTTFGTLMNINIAGRWMPHAPQNLIDRYIDPYVYIHIYIHIDWGWYPKSSTLLRFSMK